MQIKFTRRWPYASESGSVGLIPTGTIITVGKDLSEALCQAALRQNAAVRVRNPLRKALTAGDYENK